MAIKFIDVIYKDIFDKLNLEIKSNQIISLVGKNGSGKTSFLNLIYGLDLDFSGKITIDRKNVHNKIKNQDLDTIRKKQFYLIQEFENQLFNINTLEDIKYVVPDYKNDELDELLKTFNLNKDILKKPFFELSLGEQKKLLLIIMVLKDCKIVLLDDPTRNLDQKSIDNLIKLLKKEKRNNKIIIISSQDSDFLLSITDTILMIEHKNILEIENKYNFFENKELLNKCNLVMPKVLLFKEVVLNKKNIKLMNRDNINDLIKDIYRSAK